MAAQNRLIEFILACRDKTSQGVKSAIAKIDSLRKKSKENKDVVSDSISEVGKASQEAAQKTASASDAMGMAFHVLHGKIEDVAKDVIKVGMATAEVKAKGSSAANVLTGGTNLWATALGKVQKALIAVQANLAAVGMAAGAVMLIVKIWQMAKEGVEAANKALRDGLWEMHTRVMEGLAKATQDWAESLDRANKKLTQNLAIQNSLTSSRANATKARLEASREDELARLSIHDTEGRNAINKRYDQAVRQADIDARERQYEDANDAIQQRVWNAQDNIDKLKSAIKGAQSGLAAAKTMANDLEVKAIVDPEGMKDEFDKAKQAVKDAQAQLEDYKKQLTAAEDTLEALHDERDRLEEEHTAAQARDVADEKRRAREELDAQEQAADELQEYYDDLYEQDLAEWQRVQDEKARLEEQAAQERVRMELEAERKIHAQKVKDTQAELAEQAKAQGAAQSRLAAAKSQVSQAWGWYRNNDAMQAHIDDVLAQRRAEKQFEKDFKQLQSRHRDWRDLDIGKLSASEEATRQVALAKEEEQAAQKALDAIEENTRNLAEKLDELLTAKEE